MHVPVLLSASVLNFARRSNCVRLQRNVSLTASLKSSFKVQTHEEFVELVKKSKVPVVVDFFATWCNPCRMLAPRLETVISENKGKVVLAKVDIDELSDLALDYEVASVPVLLAISDGKVKERLVGLQDTDKLRKFIENLLQGAGESK